MKMKPAQRNPKHKDDRKRAMKKNQEFFSWVNNTLSMPISIFIARHTSITPTQLTIASIVVAVLSSLLLGVSGYINDIFKESTMTAYELRIIGAILAYAFFTLDGIDGKVARLTGRTTLTGKWWDVVAGHSALSLMFLGLAVGLRSYTALLIGFVAAMSYLVAYLQIAMHKLEFGALMEKKRVDLIRNRSRWSYLYGMSLFFPLLLIASIINYPMIPLVFYAVLGPLFYLVAVFFQHRAVRRLD